MIKTVISSITRKVLGTVITTRRSRSFFFILGLVTFVLFTIVSYAFSDLSSSSSSSSSQNFKFIPSPHLQNHHNDHHRNTNLPQHHRGTVAICFFGLVKGTTNELAEAFVNKIYRPLWRAGYSTVTLVQTPRMSSFVNLRNGETGTSFNQMETLDLYRKHFLLSKSESLKYFNDTDEFPTIDDEENQFITHFSKEGDSEKLLGTEDEYLTIAHPWPEFGVNNTSLKYYLRQQFSLIKLSEMLRKEDQKRKFVGAFYLRPDLLVVDELDIGLFEHMIETETRIALPVWVYRHPRVLNDRFAYGSVHAMLHYGFRGYSLKNFSMFHKPHAEMFLRYYLCNETVNANLEVHLVRMRMSRLRSGGFFHFADTPEYLDTLAEIHEKRFVESPHNQKCPKMVWRKWGDALQKNPEKAWWKFWLWFS